MTPRAACYIRVSTEEQAREGFSVTAQRERLAAYCLSQGWEIHDTYADEGYSGKDMKRPQLQRLIAHAKERRFDVALVWRLDRLSRRQAHVLHLIEDVFEANNVGFRSATESFDTTTPAGKAMVGMLAVFAQLERETIIERSRMGLEERTREGLWSGRAPFGYRYDPKDGKLKISPAEASIVRLIYQLYLTGEGAEPYGLKRVADYLRQHGVPSPFFRNPGAWNFSTVRLVLGNRSYCGYRRLRGDWVKSEHETIIDEVTWQRTQLEMQARRDDNHRYSRADYLLTGLAYCAECGGKLRGKHQKWPTGGRAYYYVCKERFEGRSACHLKWLRVEAIDARVVQQIERLSEHQVRAEVLGELSAAEPRPEAELISLEKELRSVDRKIGRYLETFDEGELAAEDVRRHLAALQEQRNALRTQRAQVEALAIQQAQDRMDPEQQVQAVLDFPALYAEGTPEERKTLLRSLVHRVDVWPGGNVKVTLRGPYSVIPGV